MIAAAAIGLTVHVLADRRTSRSPIVAALLAALTIVSLPLGGAALFLGYALHRFRGAARDSVQTRRVAAAALEGAELVALGLAGGLSIPAAHESALSHAPLEIRPALTELVDRMGQRGAQEALGTCRGPLHSSSEVLAGAVASGAPALPALEAHIRTEHHRRHAAAVEAARRLPIRLLVPLTLLVLPGFVVITVGPTIVDSLARLTL